jgi:VanZ family protein
VGIILIATLLRLDFQPDVGAALHRLARALAPRPGWDDAVDALRNVTLFAGMGAVWIVTSVAPRLGSEIRGVTIAGFSLSTLVEGLQLFSPVRTASIMDVATNGTGALLGAAGTALVIAAVHRARGRRSYFGVPMLLLALSNVIAVAAEAVTPLFRSSPLRGLHGPPLVRLRFMLRLAEPLERWQIPWLDVPLFAAAAFLAVMLRVESGHETRTAWRWVAIVGVALAFILEPAHGAIGLSVRWEAAITHAVALVLGAWAASRLLPALTQTFRGAERARVALAAYGALLVVWGWRPLLPELHLDDLSLAQFIPMESLAVRTDVFTAMHVLQQFFLYLPLGALLAVWPLKRMGFWSGVTPAIAFAAVIEVGHLAILGRSFDITNALLAWAGVVIGAVIVRRSGFAPYGEALGSAS